MIGRNPEFTLEAHLRLGQIYFTTDRYEQAIEHYQKALTLDPYDDISNRVLGYAYLETGDTEKSFEVFEHYAEVFPEDAEPYIGLGKVKIRASDLKQAEFYFRKAFSIKSDYLSVSHLTYVNGLEEKYVQALKCINEWIPGQTGQERALGYRDKAIYYAWQGCYEKSINNLKSAITIGDSIGNIDVVRNNFRRMGYIYFDYQKPGLSRKAFNRYFNLAMQQGIIILLRKTLYYYDLAQLDLIEGKIDSANYRLNFIKSNLNDIAFEFWKEWFEFNTQYLSAEIALAEGRIDDAISHAIQYSDYYYNDVNPFFSFPVNRDILARAFIQNGEIEKAITEYQRLTTFAPNSKDRRLIHPKYHYRLGKLYEHTGQTDKAIEKYKRFLELWKNADAGQPDLIEAKQRLARLTNKK
jgi:tetratricopeptide (TPR) repeat protein